MGLHLRLCQVFATRSGAEADYRYAIHDYETETDVTFNGIVLISASDGTTSLLPGMRIDIGSINDVMYANRLVTHHVCGDTSISITTICDRIDIETFYEALSNGRDLGKTVFVEGMLLDLEPGKRPGNLTYCHYSDGNHIEFVHEDEDTFLLLDWEFYGDIDCADTLRSMLREIRGQ